MMKDQDALSVTSHLGRDLLQSAGLFKTDRVVIWEYVSNGLQYVEHDVNPMVHVRMDQVRRTISIKDNGRGMSWDGLKNFFVMHGENLDRKEGRPGRGMFGTGKSAAFGIADTLCITTVCDGKRSKVRLARSSIESVAAQTEIPIEIIEKELLTGDPNGTLVEIEDIHLPRLDRPGTIKYIERHLAKWPRGCGVVVNNHDCEYQEPSALRTVEFKPSGKDLEKLGEVTLTLKVSASSLDDEVRGVAVLSNGVWHESTLGTAQGKEMSQHIFGEIDVARLDEDRSPIPPFDVSRSMSLNPANELVRAIHSFVSRSVEELRRELVAEERKRKETQDAKRLQKTAEDIAAFLNEDFSQFRQRLARVRARIAGGADAGASESAGEGDDDLIFGTEEPAGIDTDEGGEGHGDGASTGGGAPASAAPTVSEADDNAERLGRRVSPSDEGKKRRPRGGFEVDFKNLGDDRRAVYARDTRTIVVNLDHPQVKAALGSGNVEDPIFKRLAYEVAFTEYAVAIHMEMAQNDQYIDLTDPIVDIQETIDRISRRTALLYAIAD